MDRVKLLGRHTRDYTVTTDQGSWGDSGWVPNVTTINLSGVLLPLNNTDLQRLDRGDVTFKDRKLYTKTILNEDDELIDRKGEKWVVFGELEYDDIADIKRYIVRRVKNG